MIKAARTQHDDAHNTNFVSASALAAHLGMTRQTWRGWRRRAYFPATALATVKTNAG